MAENVNAYAGVTEIVFQNNRFPLNGASVDDVLALLNVPANAELEVVGAALIITEKSGTKGADEEVEKETPEQLRARIAATLGAETLKGGRFKLGQTSDGKWVPKIPGFTLDEVAYLIEKEIPVAEVMTDEQVETARAALEARDAELAEKAKEEEQRKVTEIIEAAELEFTYEQLVGLKKALDLVKVEEA